MAQYHYTDSGLDNVFLDNGFVIHTTPYGEGVAIQDTEGLHRLIGLWLIAVPKRINGAELRFLRMEMELTQRCLADLLGSSEQNVQRWERARSQSIAGPADRLVRALYKEYATGDGSVRRDVDRLAALDEVPYSNASFNHTPSNQWELDRELEAI